MVIQSKLIRFHWFKPFSVHRKSPRIKSKIAHFFGAFSFFYSFRHFSFVRFLRWFVFSTLSPIRSLNSLSYFFMPSFISSLMRLSRTVACNLTDFTRKFRRAQRNTREMPQKYCIIIHLLTSLTSTFFRTGTIWNFSKYYAGIYVFFSFPPFILLGKNKLCIFCYNLYETFTHPQKRRKRKMRENSLSWA